uniref:Uncharacterized protein n=1 Tax=Panagrolaimus superbus TaxID=310955 RepID=A0A914YTV5_9BILA
MSKTRFLPRAYHRFKDFSRFDDLESWLYTSIDFFGRKLLPWFDNMDESQIIANKERFFFDAFEEIFTYAPKQLQVLQKYIDKNNDGDKPNYTFMGITLVGMRDKLKFPYTGPFDFQQASGNAHSGKAKHKRATKEERVPDDGCEAGPAIAPVRDEVFQEGEAEQPQQENDGKPSLNADRALSMARKKKPSRNGATAKAANHDVECGDQGPLKPVDPGVSLFH